jgi:ribosome-associated protein
MIRITETIGLDEGEVREKFIRSSGPGGQNVNKVATAVELRFDVRRSRSLPGEVRERLIRLAGKQVTRDGVLIIEAGRFRTQEQNRRDARERLIRWVRKAALPPKTRRKTRPSGKSVERRLEAKHLQSEIKRRRKPVPPSESG